MRLASIVSVITVLQLTALFSLMWVSQISFASPAVLVVVVDDDGMASPTDCDSTDTAYTSIQVAIDAASPRDEIIVCPGTYSEQVTIGKSGLRVTGYSRRNSSQSIVLAS
ncbi:MAG: hypothetical protein QXM16_01980 [Nitrososphaerota archaeon]